MIHPRFEENKILVFRETSSQETVPQSSDSWEETF